MKKIRILCFALITFFLFYGCKKLDWKDPSRLCKIIETSGRTLKYNAWGDPVSATYKIDPNSTGRPTFYFIYDKNHRLTAYGGGNDHHLFYNSKGQAVIDTMIMNYAGQDDRYEQKLSYDNYGRISKMVEKQYHTGQPDPDRPPVFEEVITEYHYDGRGNLIIEGVSYDNKTCLYRTNPIWMLIHRNYSVNNPVGATTYNAAGLPQTFYNSFLDGGYPVTGILYDCGGGNEK